MTTEVTEVADALEEKPKPTKRKPRKSAKKADVDVSESGADGATETQAQSATDSTADEKPVKKPHKRAAKKAKPKPKQVSATDEPAISNGNAEPEGQVEIEPSPAKWTPPAPTVDPETAPKKAGWWGKR